MPNHTIFDSKRDASFPWLLVLIAVFLFAYYEALADAALVFFSVDVYFLARSATGVVFTLGLITHYTRQYNKKFNSLLKEPQNKLLSPLQYFSLLSVSVDSLHVTRYTYAWLHIVFWCLSASFLSLAFAKADFIISAYIFFALHPIWTFAIKQYIGESEANKYLVYPSLVAMIIGLIVFLIGKEGLNSDALLVDFPAYALAFLGGIAFSITNIAGGEAQHSTDKSEPAKYRQYVYRNYLQLGKYIFGLLFTYFLVAYVFVDSGFDSFLFFKYISEIKISDIEHIKHMISIYHLYAMDLYTAVVIFLLVASCIACVANYLLFLAFCVPGKAAAISALELFSIPLGVAAAALHGFFEPPVYPVAFYGGFVIQMGFAGLAVFLIEGGFTKQPQQTTDS